jgi:hypothetical protein
MLDLLSEPQQWINESGDKVFVVSFFTRKGTLQVPRYISNINSELHGLSDGFHSLAYDENTCMITAKNTSTFVANGLQALESRGYRRAEEASTPPPGFDPPN